MNQRLVVSREVWTSNPSMEVFVFGDCERRYSNLIGISGKIGTGKTTLADALGYSRRSFADCVREEVGDYIGRSPEWVRTHKNGVFPITDEKMLLSLGVYFSELPHIITVRELLQRWGTQYRRGEDPDYWIKETAKRLDAEEGPIILDDVRFANEAELVRDRGGLLVRLEPYPGWQPGEHADHESETALDDYEGFHLMIRPGFGGSKAAADIVRQEFLRAKC